MYKDKEINKAFSRARHTNKTKDWARYKQLKTTVQREARKAHDQYVDKIIFGDMKNNTKQFWSYLKSKIPGIYRGKLVI
jgi:hypothetical protein